MKKNKTFVKKYWRIIIGAIAGAACGYLYWRFIGCTSGTCPITSSPLTSTIFGTLFGALFFSMLKTTIKGNE